jgi:hypothetical protein
LRVQNPLSNFASFGFIVFDNVLCLFFLDLNTVQEKKELLGVLGDIEIAQGLLKNKEEKEAQSTEVHFSFLKFVRLHC